MTYFQNAREKDPSFALAHSGLADALMVLPISGDVATNRSVSSDEKRRLPRRSGGS